MELATQFWAGLLLANYYFLSPALFGVVFIAMTHVFGARWAVAFRRVPEAMTAYLPIGALLMLALVFGRAELYPWARPDVVAASHHLQHKAAYLNVPFFFLRMVIVLGVWLAFAAQLVRHSRLQDIDGEIAHTRRSRTVSAVFLALFALTFIIASFDWIMSLEPEWYSTIFPLYLGTGMFLGGTAAMIAIVILLQQRGLLDGVTAHHRYELARMLGAASTAWGFVWYYQYMLIQYTNIPEEAIYLVRRLEGLGRLPGTDIPLLLLPLVVNWIVPLAMLIPPRTRNSAPWLLRICAVVLVGRWLDLYVLILPALGSPLSGLGAIFVTLALAPVFGVAVLRAFRKANSVPIRDPYLSDSLALES